MKKITLIGTDEGLFDYNRNVNFDSIKNVEIQLQLHAEMVFKEDVDTVMMMVLTRYLQGKEQLISYGVSLHFSVAQWAEYVKDMKDDDILATEEVHRMLGIAIGYLRGSLSLQLRSTSLKGAFLPLVNIESLSKQVKINRLPKQLTEVSEGKK